MRTFLFTAISIMLFLSCCVRSDKTDDKDLFYIQVSLGGDIRSGKDYIKCWVDDSLLYEGVYRDRYNADSVEYMGEYGGIYLPPIDRTFRDSIKIKLRFISLDSVLFCGKRVIDTTFVYRIDNIPTIATGYARTTTGNFYVFDTLRTPDFFTYYY